MAHNARADRNESPAERTLAALRRLNHSVRRHRRLIAATCTAVAVALAITATTPRTPPTVNVVTATHDLVAGTTLRAADLTSVALPRADVPVGALTNPADIVGRSLAGGLRRGEPITDVRLAGGPLGVPTPGLVAAPVRFADAQAAELLQPGQHVDVLAASTATGTDQAPQAASVVAADVSVVAIPRMTASPGDVIGPDAQGALVVLATTTDQARALAQAEVTARLSAVVVR